MDYCFVQPCISMRGFFFKSIIMKKYFAKYLPVEGEIRKGNKLIDPTMSQLGVMEALTDKEGSKIKKRGGSKVKLFLCSRDIQKGDKNVYVEPSAMESYQKGLRFEVTNIEQLEGGYRNAEIKYIANPVYPPSVGHTREWPADNIWKVIGEISPDAGWVKEGDEFDEDEVDIWWKNPNMFYQKFMRQNANPTDTSGLILVAEIKGDCGYFH